MALIGPIRQAMADQLQSISGLRRFPYAPDKVNPPCAAIELQQFNYDVTFGRQAQAHALPFVIRVYASRALADTGQDRLDSYLDPEGPTSVRAALLTDTTLGGLAETLRVSDVDNYGVYEVGATAYFGAEISVTVWARGTL